MKMDSLQKVKGVSFLGLLESARQLRGQELVERILEKLPGDLATAIREKELVLSAWYPVEWYQHLLQAILDATGGTPDVLRQLAAEEVYRDMTKGVHKALMLVLSREFLIKRVPLVFSSYYRLGEVDVVDASSKHVRLVFTECAGFNGNMWVDIIAGLHGMIKAHRGLSVQTQIHSGGGERDTGLDIELHWD